MMKNKMKYYTGITAAPITQKTTILIGASITKGHAQFRYGTDTAIPFGVNAGSYCDLSCALYRKDFLVTNMGIGGSAVFDYQTALFGFDDVIEGFQTQLDRAFIASRLPNGEINADYGIIIWGNEHIHGLVQADRPTIDSINASTDIFISLGNQLLAEGVTPVFTKYPAWGTMDVSLFELFGAPWVINQEEWELLASTYEARITAELPDALLVDAWAGYTTIDGAHPDEESMMIAATRIEQAINDDQI